MLMNLRSKKTQRGIGLLELMLSLSIIAILLVMATRYFMTAKQSQQISDTISMVNGIIAGGANYTTQNNGSYAGISMSALASGGFIPLSFCQGANPTPGSCTGANPWHGTTTVTPSGTNAYTITMDSFPNGSVCTATASMVNASIQNASASGGGSSNASCSGTVLNVTIY